MHVDEVDTDVSLVSRLLMAQFPRWANLPIEPVRSAGTDNALYRLGKDMVVRLPRIPGAAEQVDKEQRWLPKLAPLLPLGIPVPLAEGAPGESYPWNWSIYRWLEGVNATVESTINPHETAAELAMFVAALQRVDPAGGPSPGKHNFNRGEPLANRDGQTRAAIALLDGSVNATAATAAWEADSDAPVWRGPPTWIHGDLQPTNLLVSQGKLSAVIDFGGLGVGDPACDLILAWNFFTGETRNVFRRALRVDDATWARGRAWALSVGLIALPYYQSTNPTLAKVSRYAINEVLADHKLAPRHGQRT